MARKNTLRGEGPWEFEIPGLSPGESHRLDFRNMKFNGQRGYFREYLPLDDAQVTNTNSSEPLKVEINNEFDARVQPNSERAFADSGVTYLTIKNVGANATSDGEVTAEVSSAGYGADQAARERKQRRAGQSLAEKALRDLVPGLSQ